MATTATTTTATPSKKKKAIGIYLLTKDRGNEFI
jgi:hypothetical protein